MEESSIENQEELLSFDSIAREQLSEAARWARFLAIMGFIACGIIVLAGIGMGIVYFFINTASTRYNYSGSFMNSAGRSGFIGLLYIIASVIFLFRCLYMYRFADKMRSGLHVRSRDQVNESFLNLKKMFRYNGIMTIVLVLLYVVILLAALIVAVNR